MNAIILPDYNANIIRAMKSLRVGETQIPKPAGGQVLIKVVAAPCNPSDIAFLRGGYNVRKPVPAVMGFECTGTVVESGPDPKAQMLKGKRVSCFGDETDGGTWAEYFMTRYENCIEITEALPDEQAAAFCINPFTAYAMIRMAIESKVKTIIQNGASGQIGIFIRKLAGMNGIQVINLVRKEDHLEKLKQEGEKHVLGLNQPDFENRLHQLAHSLEAVIAFDAVGGEWSGQILNAMPAGATLVVYGGLSGKPLGALNPMDIIFKGKTVKGFNLNQWKKETDEKKFQEVSSILQQLILNHVLHTRIQGEFPLEEVQQAMEQYIRNMSAGKILFTP